LVVVAAQEVVAHQLQQDLVVQVVVLVLMPRQVQERLDKVLLAVKDLAHLTVVVAVAVDQRQAILLQVAMLVLPVEMGLLTALLEHRLIMLEGAAAVLMAHPVQQRVVVLAVLVAAVMEVLEMQTQLPQQLIQAVAVVVLVDCRVAVAHKILMAAQAALALSFSNTQSLYPQ